MRANVSLILFVVSLGCARAAPSGIQEAVSLCDWLTVPALVVVRAHVTDVGDTREFKYAEGSRAATKLELSVSEVLRGDARTGSLTIYVNDFVSSDGMSIAGDLDGVKDRDGFFLFRRFEHGEFVLDQQALFQESDAKYVNHGAYARSGVTLETLRSALMSRDSASCESDRLATTASGENEE